MLFMKALELKQVGPDMELQEFSQMNLGGYFPMRLLNMAIGSLLGKQLKQTRDKLIEIQSE